MNRKRIKSKRLTSVLVSIFLVASMLQINMLKVNAGTEKFKKTINVTSKAYGAKNGTDSTKAIQKALDDAAAAATAKERVMVSIPKGTYYINRSLRISSNTYLKCDKETKLVKGSKDCIFLIRGKNSGKGSYKDLSNITIDGGIWDAKFIERNAESGGTIMYFTHANNLLIMNATMRNVFGASHMIEVGASDHVTITKCDFYGYKSDAEGSEKEAIQLDVAHNSHIEPDAAPYDDTACTNVEISYNKIHDCARGIGSHSAVKDVYHTNINIHHNKFYNLSAEAVYVVNYYKTTINKNNFDNVAAGVVIKPFNPSVETMYSKAKKGAVKQNIKNGNYEYVITNNTITTSKKNIAKDEGQIGIYINAEGGKEVSGSVITGNTIKSACSGIVLKNSNNNIVEKNKIYRNCAYKTKISYSVDGINLIGSSGNVINKNNVKYGTKNKFENCISLRDKSINNEITNNNFSLARENNIKLAGDSGAKIVGNTISDSGTDGIALYTSCTAVMSGNKILNSGNSGLFIYSNSKVTMPEDAKETTIIGSKKNAMRVTNGSCAELNNIALDKNKGYGIFVFSNAELKIKNSSITNSDNAGINVNGSNAVIDNVKLDNNNGYGIIFTKKSTGSIENSEVSRSANTGIYITGSTLGNISGNSILNNKNRGMDITGSTVGSIRNNIFSNPSASIEMRIYNSKTTDEVVSIVSAGEKDDYGNYSY